MRGSSNRVAALTVWVVALSVAIAVVGSSTVLFPGPDIGDRPTSPSSRELVARIVAPFFNPSPAQEREAAPAGAVESPAPVVTAPVPLVAIPAGLAAERPVRTRPDRGTTKPRSDQSPPGARADKGKGKTKDGANARGKGKADTRPHGKAVAGAKSQGHGQGHLKSTPPRGPKQPHVQPAQGHGKSKGRARGHARAGR